MTAAVLAFPAPLSVAAAWSRYAALRRQEIATPALMLDRSHAEAVARAYQFWSALFLESDAAQ